MPGPGENTSESIAEDQTIPDKRIDVQPLQPAKSILKVTSSEALPGDEGPGLMRRNISWQDFHGNQALTQVHHFEPSESGSYDDEDAPEGKPCCTIS